ncbi:hypothetical protein HHK36_011831 [Tetracentron sinense]|uniref:Uncharacterized protein n=1 Tax=Tetracentron sinense TaxID=13715 RepID=A0A835DK83_TETSI|nr:hypothetical protein HHK36_011831 [Tetracentron sinense]
MKLIAEERLPAGDAAAITGYRRRYRWSRSELVTTGHEGDGGAITIPGFWQPTVPAWEKKFCFLVGSIPWGKLLETKKVMSYHENVVQWNDSAGEEAFNNAKKRFWAEINGLPCNISLPDPDIYIDEVDWNSEIDPELLLDLDKKPVVSDEEEKDSKVELLGDYLFYLNQPVVCTGWGDAVEDPIKTANNSPAGPYLRDGDRKAENGDFPWELGHTLSNVAVEKKWGDCEEAINGSENLGCRRTGGDPGTQNGNWMKREDAGQYMSRYKTSRFQDDYLQTDDHGWRTGRGRNKVDFSYAPQQWNSIKFCVPISHRGSGEAGNPWNWEKPVS